VILPRLSMGDTIIVSIAIITQWIEIKTAFIVEITRKNNYKVSLLKVK